MAPDGKTLSDAVVGSGTIQFPGSAVPDYSDTTGTKYTEVTEDLYYSNGSLGTLK